MFCFFFAADDAPFYGYHIFFPTVHKINNESDRGQNVPGWRMQTRGLFRNNSAFVFGSTGNKITNLRNQKNVPCGIMQNPAFRLAISAIIVQSVSAPQATTTPTYAKFRCCGSCNLLNTYAFILGATGSKSTNLHYNYALFVVRAKTGFGWQSPQ